MDSYKRHYNYNVLGIVLFVGLLSLFFVTEDYGLTANAAIDTEEGFKVRNYPEKELPPAEEITYEPSYAPSRSLNLNIDCPGSSELEIGSSQALTIPKDSKCDSNFDYSELCDSAIQNANNYCEAKYGKSCRAKNCALTTKVGKKITFCSEDNDIINAYNTIEYWGEQVEVFAGNEPKINELERRQKLEEALKDSGTFYTCSLNPSSSFCVCDKPKEDMTDITFRTPQSSLTGPQITPYPIAIGEDKCMPPTTIILTARENLNDVKIRLETEQGQLIASAKANPTSKGILTTIIPRTCGISLTQNSQLIMIILRANIAIARTALETQQELLPEPLPPTKDSWSFLPEYKPGESVYEQPNIEVEQSSGTLEQVKEFVKLPLQIIINLFNLALTPLPGGLPKNFEVPSSCGDGGVDKIKEYCDPEVDMNGELPGNCVEAGTNAPGNCRTEGNLACQQCDTIPYCGDGKKNQEWEECDDDAFDCERRIELPFYESESIFGEDLTRGHGLIINSIGKCTNDCRCINICGDGFIDSEEECDIQRGKDCITKDGKSGKCNFEFIKKYFDSDQNVVSRCACIPKVVEQPPEQQPIRTIDDFIKQFNCNSCAKISFYDNQRILQITDTCKINNCGEECQVDPSKKEELTEKELTPEGRIKETRYTAMYGTCIQPKIMGYECPQGKYLAGPGQCCPIGTVLQNNQCVQQTTQLPPTLPSGGETPTTTTPPTQQPPVQQPPPTISPPTTCDINNDPCKSQNPNEVGYHMKNGLCSQYPPEYNKPCQWNDKEEATNAPCINIFDVEACGICSQRCHAVVEAMSPE